MRIAASQMDFPQDFLSAEKISRLAASRVPRLQLDLTKALSRARTA
jgi:hypothetical protein